MMILGFGWLLSFGLYLWGTIYSVVRLRIRSVPPVREWPPISILKPLKGNDPGLYENLQSFMVLDYPEYEVIFSVADENDPGLPVVRKLIADYAGSRVKTSLIVGQDVVGLNPKVNNLSRPLAQARYDGVLISDSHIRVRPGYLREIAAEILPNTGIVTSVVAGSGGRYLGGRLEELHMNSYYARWMLYSRSVGTPFVLGASIYFSKERAEIFGGLRAVANHINEDYILGRKMRHAKYKIELLTTPITQHIGERTFAQFWNRHVRWGVIQKYTAPEVFLLEPLQFMPVLATIAALIFNHFNLPWYEGALGTLGLWWVMDYLVITSVGGRMNSLIWALRELCAVGIFIHALFTTQVSWRGNLLRVARHGRIAGEVPNSQSGTKSEDLDQAS